MAFDIKLKTHHSLEIREMPNICFQHSQISMIHFKTLLPTYQVLREKLMPLNKILGSQAKTQLWALEMVPKGFWCGDKPIQARHKGCT